MLFVVWILSLAGTVFLVATDAPIAFVVLAALANAFTAPSALDSLKERS